MGIIHVVENSINTLFYLLPDMPTLLEQFTDNYLLKANEPLSGINADAVD